MKRFGLGKTTLNKRGYLVKLILMFFLLVGMLTSAVSATDNLVLAPGGAYITVSSSSNPSVVGQNVTFTIHVDVLYYNDTATCILPAQGGTVQLRSPGDARRISDVAQVQNGIATITTNCFSYVPPYQPAPGTYSMMVAYVWGPIDCDSQTITQTVVEKNEIPEFPSIVIPAVASLGLLLIFGKKRSD